MGAWLVGRRLYFADSESSAVRFADLDGRVAIDYGVYGAPESFLIDKEGVIRYKQIGPIDNKALNEKLLPMIRKLNQ